MCRRGERHSKGNPGRSFFMSMAVVLKRTRFPVSRVGPQGRFSTPARRSFVFSQGRSARRSLSAGSPEPLSNWNDDLRADRLSHCANLSQSLAYLKEADGLMTEKARLAFKVRVLIPPLLKSSPVQAVKLFRRALAEGACCIATFYLCRRAVFPTQPWRCSGECFPPSRDDYCFS